MDKKIYNYSYYNGEMEIKEVVVKETAKMFKSNENNLMFCNRQINKDELNRIHEIFGGYFMVAEKSNPELFKQLIIKLKERDIDIVKSKLLKYEKELKKISEYEC